MPAPTPSFIGREQELSRLGELLGEVGPGGRAIVVEGEAGIGKSTFVDAVAALAGGRGFRELRCTGVHSETTSGFAGLHELLHPVLDRLDTLPAKQRQALEVALGQADGPTPSRLMTGLATLGLLEEYASEQPTLVVVEDAQWLDASSAQALAFAARRLTQARILLIATVRPGFEVFPSIPVLALGSLTPDESERVLRDQHPVLDAATRALVLAEAVGNPLALHELPQALATGTRPDGEHWLPMTRRLEQAFLAGAADLPASSRRMLLLIAAAPESSLRHLLAAASGAGLNLGDLGPIEQAGLATVTGDRILLRHPLVRSAVYGAASFADRMAAHRTLAAAATDPDRAAWHAAAATPDYNDEVAAALEASANRARDRSALIEAVAALRRSAALSASVTDRARRLAAGAEIARQAGEVADSVLLVRTAWPLADDPDVLAQLILTEVALGASAAVPGHTTDELLDLVDRMAGPDGDAHRTQRLRVLATAATAHAIHMLPGDLRERLDRALADADGGTGSLHALVGHVLIDPARYAARAREQLPDLARRVREFLSASRSPSRSQMIIGAGLLAEALHDLPAALDCWDLGVDHFHRAGAPGDEAWILRQRALVRVGLGRLRDGLSDAEMALRLSTDLGLRVTTADAGTIAARAYAWQGDNDRARAALEHAEGLDVTFIRARSSWAAGLVALNEHRYEQAWTALSAAQASATTGLWSLADLTEAAVRTERGSQVLPLLEAAARQAEAFARPYLDNLVRRGLAQVEPGPEAEEHYEAALAGSAGNPGRLEVARTRLAYGSWLRRRKRIVDAREHLGAALRAFETAGALPWAERATIELRAAGVAPAASRPAGPASAQLTPQELRIVELAAEGLTNKEIADQLYLSHRTIATHLYKVFPKLGISNRNQLRSALVTE
ncbi:LuxR family transcriptional regulator [Actinoplanes sp. TRM 88003]|uniref:LuxR family transcriptional regulator n=1 Tax=Paractinoplanes aksuensis TaxID=2939490 RepID=A0ABT1DSZ8_9ACTN|nr:AAA family ATPase [Actinoplanes aksuensis]MCO8273961.1 LuxR family transcriptional regulator [Actinoplanes aksuensis]